MSRFTFIPQGVFSIIFLAFIVSCESNSSSQHEDKKVDSSEMKESIRQAELNKILIQEKPDFILDSLDLEYTIDGQKILNKKVLVDISRVRDIYEDKERVNHIIINGSYRHYIDLICTSEQIKIIRDDNYKSSIYLVISPISFRKIDLEYVSSVDGDFFEEGEKPTAQIDIEDLHNRFIIKGKLINIKTIANE